MARAERLLSEPPARDLAGFEERLGYHFRDRSLLATALRHASRANEDAVLESNERLEFLGDSVVGLAVAHRLFAAHDEWAEGDLTRGLHGLVDTHALARLATRLALSEVIELGRTELRSGGAVKQRILANAMEAVIGAMFLDGGLDVIGELVERAFPDSFQPGAERTGRDPKTELQELAVACWGDLPRYSLVSDSDIEGDDERFIVEVWLASGQSARGSGRSKRAAERLAAETMLATLPEDEEVR